MVDDDGVTGLCQSFQRDGKFSLALLRCQEPCVSLVPPRVALGSSGGFSVSHSAHPCPGMSL